MILWLNIIRWKNLLIIWISIFVIVLPHFDPQNPSPFYEFILWAIICSTIAASGNIMNDWLDVKQDKENKKPNIFINNQHKKTATILIILLMILCSWAIWSSNNQMTLGLLAVIAFLLLSLYNFIFKKIAILGNILIGILSAMVFVGVDIIVSSRLVYFEFGFDNKQIELFAGFAFVTTVIREIIKDAEDRKGDLWAGFNTIARFLNDQAIAIIILFMSLAGTTLVYLMMQGRQTNFLYHFTIYAIWANIISISAFILLLIPHPAKYIRASRTIKAGMLGSLIIYLILSY